MYQAPRLLTAGEAGLVVEFSDRVDPLANQAARSLEAALPAAWEGRGWPPTSLAGAVPTYRSLLVRYDPLRVPAAQLQAVLFALAQESLAAARRGGAAPAGRRVVEIPVCYQGELAPDLAEVASLTGVSRDEVVRLHIGQPYLVHMLGFQIGYPYLASVPERLRLPRLARPRLRTGYGSVAIAGELTGIYSLPSPGGWRVLGTTPVRLWDLAWDPPTLLQPGDEVRFCPVDRAEYDRRLASGGGMPAAQAAPGPADLERAGLRPAVQVLDAGLLATVQDLGRPGYWRYGLGPGGAMDRFALRVGNRLLGNSEGSAALEVTGQGTRLELLDDMELVWTGSDAVLELNGVQVPAWTVQRARPGQVLWCRGLERGFRGYLCVEGGFGVPPVLGSRSTNLGAGFGGFGGRALRSGDLLPRAAAAGARPGREGARADRAVIDGVYAGLDSSSVVLGLVPGPQADFFDDGVWNRLESYGYEVSGESNRMGYRLVGPPLPAGPGHDIVSDGLVEGAVQVPGSGHPVLMMADYQTTGGYPKLGVVPAADLPRAAQLAPGRWLRFRRTSLAEARQGHLALEHAVAEVVGSLRRWTLRLDGRRYEIVVDTAGGPRREGPPGAPGLGLAPGPGGSLPS